MHILLFYQYYHNLDCPASGRHYQFLKALGQRHHITVLSTDIWQRKRISDLYDWLPGGVKLHAFPVPYHNAMSIPARLNAYGGYALRSFVKGLSIPRPDVIVGSSTPLTAAWAAAKVAAFRRIPWIFEVRDLWPDFPIQMGAVQSTWIQKRLYRLESKLYASASHVITLSTDMERALHSKGVPPEKVTTLENGTDLDLANTVHVDAIRQLRKQHNLEHKRIILYAGTLGRANAIPDLVQLAGRMVHRKDVHFVFLGEGYYEHMLKKASATQPNLSILPSVPRHDIFRWFAMADLSLVSFIDLPVLQANSPAKFFDSLASGTPVLVTNPGWTRSFVETHKCGWYAPIQELDAMVRCIEKVLDAPEERKGMGQRGKAIAATHFDRSTMVHTFEKILYQSATKKRRGMKWKPTGIPG